MLPYRQRLSDPCTLSAQDKAAHIAPPVSLNDAIQRSQRFLLSIQNSEGYWWAEVEGNVSITAQILLVFKVWGVHHRLPMQKIESYLRGQQRHHGGWELSPGDGGNLNPSVEAYMALRLLNVPTSDPALQKARKFVLERGGLSKATVFTKLHLAFIGCFDWRGVPSLPPWIMLLPNWFPTTIYDMSSWARLCIVPLMIILESKSVFAIDPPFSMDELFVEQGETGRYDIPKQDAATRCFIILDRVLKLQERFNLAPWRERALKAAEQWMLKRQEVSGIYGGIGEAAVYSLIAMRVQGYSCSDPTVEQALQSVSCLAVETEDEYYVQSTVSPTWDTAFSMRALVHSGLSRDHSSLRRAGEWLLQKQILHSYGDCMVKCNKGRPGGWPFQFHNAWYPDVDDTAVVVMALNEVELSNEPAKQAAIARAVEWIAAMQCKAGGWGAFDVNNDQAWLNAIPLGEFTGMIDPNTADVTSRVLEMQGRIRKSNQHLGVLPKQAIDRALEYLRKKQEADGCWYGRWGVNYIFGTCWALEAIALIAPKEHEQEIARGARWLVECQRKDGGWGETCYSYTDPSLRGQGKLSTMSQTSWALMGLLAAGNALGKYETDAMERGVKCLLETQQSDGTWHELAFTGTAFPSYLYLKYHLYALNFSLTALSRYRDLVQDEVSSRFRTLDIQT